MFRAAMATLPATDIDRARTFYQGLGFEVGESEDDGSSRIQVGDTWIMLYPSAFAGTNQATAVGIGVDDVPAAVADLRGRNVQFEEYDFGEMKTVDGIITMPNGQKGAWFKDTEGNIVGLFDGDM
ncbi:MAG: VOC family protein [Acidimicrobiia bacterium]|nr:VOC family protein [Acidimicrobiia bacterium]